MRYLLIALVRAWRAVISPLYGDVCKYYPSCSDYALDALRYRGAVVGSWLTMRRLLRCHPWAHEAVDFVPGSPRAQAYEADLAGSWASSELTPAGTSRTRPDDASSMTSRGEA